jgi:acetyl esterase/lipase
LDVEEGVTIKVWIVRPKNMEEEENAAFVFAHGGAGTMLSAEENLPECYRYAIDWNCIVFSVDYRKGPETKCPA